MARPRRLNVVVIPLKLWLLPGRDDDLIQYLENIPPGQRAAAVMRAMRGDLLNRGQDDGETDEVNDILDNLGETWN